jgi:hypothetical protein
MMSVTRRMALTTSVMVSPAFSASDVALLHALHAGADQALDFLGRFGAAPGQAAHFAGHHGKASALLTCAGGFDGCVERQDVGLEGDAVDHADDVGDLVAGGA